MLRTVNVWNEVQSVRVSLLRLGDIFETRPEQPRGEAAPPLLPPVTGHLRFEKVTFRYTDGRVYLLAYPGVKYDKADPSPGQLTVSYNDDTLKKQ